MANRRFRKKTFAFDKRVLKSGVQAYKGSMLCIDTSTGECVVGTTSTTLLPWGESLDEVLGDGTLTVRAKLFTEVLAFGWENDSAPNNCAEANVASECYIKDDRTVSMLSTGRSKAGRVMQVETGVVWVEAGTAVTGPTGASGVTPDVDDMVHQDKLIPLRGPWMIAAGTPLAAFADGASTTPGLNLADSECAGVRWNNHATPAAFYGSEPMPLDLDDAEDIVLHILASKTGATVGDATTFTIGAFFQTVGALHDADVDCGGATGAMTGDATAKTVQHVTRTITAANIPAQPCSLTYSIKPTDGTLGTDDVIITAAWLAYTPKLAA